MNNKFRCIIIVDQDKIPLQEIPFLNRFEKYNISFQYLMNEEQILIANKLYENCIKMITYDENKIKLYFDVVDKIYNEIEDDYAISGFIEEESFKHKIVELNCDKDRIIEWIENDLING